jgi:hypothetical protein
LRFFNQLSVRVLHAFLDRSFQVPETVVIAKHREVGVSWGPVDKAGTSLIDNSLQLVDCRFRKFVLAVGAFRTMLGGDCVKPGSDSRA